MIVRAYIKRVFSTSTSSYSRPETETDTRFVGIVGPTDFWVYDYEGENTGEATTSTAPYYSNDYLVPPEYSMPISKPRHRYGRGPARIAPAKTRTALPRKRSWNMIRDGPNYQT